MQDVIFQCGSCGKLIGVGADRLGLPVRCPHCRQVVQPVPTAAEPTPTVDGPPAAAAAEPADASPQRAPEESPAPPAPRSDELAEPAGEPPVPAAEPVQSPPGPDAPAAVAIESSSSLPTLSLASAVFPPAPAASPAAEAEVDSAAASAPWPDDSAGAFAPSGGRETSPGAARRASQGRGGISIWYLIPLASYSILSTFLLVVLWERLRSAEVHPLAAFLPDAEGDAPGVVLKPKALSEAGKRKLNNQPLPEPLRLRLGETRTVGALEITPLRVTRERVGVGPVSSPPQLLRGPSLVLHLRLKNVSEDQSFQPLDRFFDRRWEEGRSAGPPPLTLLEAGPGWRFYGGPAEWHPRPGPGRDSDALPEFNYLMNGPEPAVDPVDRPLDPGQSAEVFVCTDGNDPRAGELVRHPGPFLWRVEVRRGLVRIRGREVPAAAVVGVAFTAREVGL